MLGQLVIGTMMIAVSIIIMSLDVAIAVVALTRFGPWVISGTRFIRLTVVLIVATLWLLAAISLSVWLWAAMLLWLEAFSDLETALYFSIVSLTTLGFGDVILEKNWRLLSGFIAANGLVLFGLSTAFLIEVVVRLNRAYEATVTNSGNK